MDTTEFKTLGSLRGTLVIANHPSLLDVVFIIANTEGLNCIIKGDLARNFFFGGVVKAAGFIPNDLEPMEFLEICQQKLSNGENILIFPEGTRTTPGKEIKFHRSLGNLALAAKADIKALILKCTPTTLTKQHKWYQIPNNRFTLTLATGSLFPYHDYDNEKPRSLRVRALMRDLQNYYNTMIGT